MPKRIIALGLLALVGGCTSLSGTLTNSPENWDDYVGRTVTVKGNAGNSPQEAIVRFEDGGYIPLRTRERWGIDAVGRPVEVTGTIVSGQGFRAEKYVIDVKSSKVMPPDQAAQDAKPSGM